MRSRWIRQLAVRVAAVLLGLAVGALLIVGFDAILGASGVDLGPLPPDPFAGFSNTQPVFVADRRLDGTTVYRTRTQRRRRFAKWQPDEMRVFAANKAPEAFRIFVVGGSSAAGVPYGVDYSFGEWLEKQLLARAPGVDWEVINAAFSGYATRRISTIVQEIVRYEPDLVIVYSGHNEFAEQRYYHHLLDRDPRVFLLMEWVAASNIYRWWFSVAPAPSTPPPSFEINDQYRSFEMFAVMAKRAGGSAYPTDRERAYGEIHFDHNLREIVHRLRSAGAKVMLLTLSQNFSDWEPGASAHRITLGAKARDTWDADFIAGERAATQDCNLALRHYLSAAKIDDSHALLNYRIATCLRGLGEFARADNYYKLASDLDRIPQGAPLAFNEVIRSVAIDEVTLLVDVQRLLEQASLNHLVGSNFFTDFVHPNIDAHQAIAQRITDEIQRSGIAGAIRWQEAPSSEPSRQQLLARQPRLEVGEHLAMGLACVLSLRRDCARESAHLALGIDPNNVVAREYLSMLQESAIWDFETGE